MENIGIIISIALTFLSFLAAVATTIIKNVRNEKAKKAAELVLKMINAVVPYVKEAEGIAGLTGPEKKQYVMEKLDEFARSNGFEIDAEQASQKIEELISLTKVLNNKPARH